VLTWARLRAAFAVLVPGEDSLVASFGSKGQYSESPGGVVFQLSPAGLNYDIRMNRFKLPLTSRMRSPVTDSYVIFTWLLYYARGFSFLQAGFLFCMVLPAGRSCLADAAGPSRI
jgi:hypothetical protein